MHIPWASLDRGKAEAHGSLARAPPGPEPRTPDFQAALPSQVIRLHFSPKNSSFCIARGCKSHLRRNAGNRPQAQGAPPSPAVKGALAGTPQALPPLPGGVFEVVGNQRDFYK